VHLAVKGKSVWIRDAGGKEWHWGLHAAKTVPVSALEGIDKSSKAP
jgi:hypothetical protein